MKNNVILSLVFILLIGCHGQKKEKIKSINSTIVMKKLDSNYLNKIKEINKENEKIQFTENDTVIELTDGGDFFFETKRKNNESICIFFPMIKRII
jgi:alpha-N-acetylglucosamine transferase